MTDVSALEGAAGSDLQGRQRSIHALTGIRFIAAAWVVLFHFKAHVEAVLPAAKALSPLTSKGALGVDLFFLLSGFIIAYNYSDRFNRSGRGREYFRFLWLRLARMYPVQLVTLLGLGFVVWSTTALHHPPNNPENWATVDFFRHLFLIDAWASRGRSWNYPSWSISAEWFAYLVFPLVAVSLRRVQRVTTSLLGAGVALGGYVLVAVAFGIDIPLVQIGGEFLAGVFLARVFTNTSSDSAWWNRAAAASAVAIALVVAFVPDRVAPHIIVFFFAVLLLALAHAHGTLSKALSGRRLLFLGEASYSLYMTHAIIEKFGTSLLSMERFADSALPIRAAIVALYTVVILASAIIMYLVIEKPARNRMRAMAPVEAYERRRAISRPQAGAIVDPGADNGAVMALE